MKENKKRDIILIVSLLLVSAVIYCAMNFFNDKAGDTVTITIDGKVYGRYDLQKDRRIEISISEKLTTDRKTSTEKGKFVTGSSETQDNAEESGKCDNVVVICDGKVYMEFADCPDKYCVKQGKISANGQSIVCLPHKLSVQITKSKPSSEDIDAIAG